MSKKNNISHAITLLRFSKNSISCYSMALHDWGNPAGCFPAVYARKLQHTFIKTGLENVW